MLTSVLIVDTLVTGDSVTDPNVSRIQHPFGRPGRTAIRVGPLAFFVLAGMAGYYTEIGLGTNTMRALMVAGPILVGGITFGALKRRLNT